MIIQPIIRGVVARSSHPNGCTAAVHEQIEYCKNVNSIVNGPKKVLILGASSGYGLASRIALAFGGANADTIGVSFERGPSEKGVGSAGWYNNIAFRKEAEKEGYIAKNFVGDAFSPELRKQVASYIKNEFGGQVDLVVYSLATGLRPNPETGKMWRSSLKTVGEPYTGYMVNLEEEKLEEMTIEPATENEIFATEKVMGGEDWEEWIRFLLDQQLLKEGAKTISYSYIGSEVTFPIYHHGTLGVAKKHLQSTADKLNTLLYEELNGEAYVTVAKALVTKASVFIPGLSPYLLCLFRVHKAMGLHERPIEQMQRLFGQRIYDGKKSVPVDEQRLIRIDDWELREDVQKQVRDLLSEMNSENFKKVGDFEGYLQEFLELNGFAITGVDYSLDINIDALKNLRP